MQFKQIIDENPSGIFITDKLGTIVYVNQRLIEISDYSTTELLGRNPRLFKSNETPDDIFSSMWQALSSGQKWSGELRNRKKNGQIYWAKASISPVRDTEGEISHFMAAIDCIDKRKRVTQELDQLRLHLENEIFLHTTEFMKNHTAVNANNHANSVFLASMCIACRTPLNTILGFSEQMLHDIEIGERNRKRLGSINGNSQHLLSLINDVFEISRFEAECGVIQRGVFDLCGLLSSIEEIIRGHAADKGLAFYIESDTDLPNFVEGVKLHLKQVLMNLLGNAVKYTNQGSVRLRIVRCKDEISFEISDTGIGIAAGDQQRIFEPFYQTQAGAVKGHGSGLGLTICREYTRIMNGQLAVNSQLGYGSTFTLIVPLPAAALNSELERVN
jgi:PAS domain S-box-containing protein